MELGEPDASGRRRPVPIEGSETLIDIDMLITAIGQSPDVSFKKNDERLDKLNISRWNTIEADNETLQSSLPYIFTAGDSATGPSLVVEAIGGGRRAARSIHQLLSDEPVAPMDDSLYKRHITESIFENVGGIVKKERVKMPELPVAERIRSFVEADLVITEEEALRESERCLNCCRLCYDKDESSG
jgi:NADPH-dependent glutamate synthase beta subunit-like oxidoreductase